MIYLASMSPRRRELLDQIGIAFELLKVDADESVLAGESPDDYVVRVAKLKAEHGAQAATQPWPVLAADTIVTIDNHILLKPAHEADAIATLSQLSGHTHQVKTAIAIACVIDGSVEIVAEVVTTDVTFRTLTRLEMIDYWRSGEPADKAGSYAIQGMGGKFVKRISGSYSAVVGLPLMETEQRLQQVLLKIQDKDKG